MEKKDVIIVVPIYKKSLDLPEKISLKQLYKVLGDYYICFVAPQRMKSFFCKRNVKVIYFEDRYFNNTGTYSELLLSDFFYEKFSKYEYMLIYQLDAFVFRDELLDFCRLGYDYIGAPVPRNCCAEWKVIKARVGNGGFSLRKIYSTRRIITNMPEIVNDKSIRELCYKYEDLFFGYCGARVDVDFSVPDIKTALKFAIDDDVSHCYRKLSCNNLPFGCHRWSKVERYQIWCKYVVRDKEELKLLNKFYQTKAGFSYRYFQWKNIISYVIYRFNCYNKEKLREIFYSNVERTQSYMIWGYGKYGVIAHKLLKQFDYSVVQILDVCKKNNEVDNIPVKVPDIEAIKRSGFSVIIAATNYDDKIKDELICAGVLDKNIVMLKDLLQKIVMGYVIGLTKKINE